MYSILLGVLTTVLDAISSGNHKKALDQGTLSSRMFKVFSFFFGGSIFITLIIVYGLDMKFFINWFDMLLLLLVSTVGVLATLMKYSVVKKLKLSDLMPYDNLDKIFIIIIGFFLFYGTDKGSSVATLLITILTVIVIGIFSVDLKKLKLPKGIATFIFYKMIKAVNTIVFGFLLVKYSSYTLAYVSWSYEVVIYLALALFLNDSFGSLTTQTSGFYKNRFASSIFGNISYIIGLYIIQSAGIIVATLLGFFGIVFKIISMKLLLNDTPTKKQVLLAVIVLTLIGIGLYLK